MTDAKHNKAHKLTRFTPSYLVAKYKSLTDQNGLLATAVEW